MIVGMPPASARNSTTFLALLWADNRAGASRIAKSTFFMPEIIGGGQPRGYHRGHAPHPRAAPRYSLMTPALAEAATAIRIMPPDGGVLAAGQLVDIRVEAAAPPGRRRRASGCGSTASNGRRATIRARRKARRRARPISSLVASAAARQARSSSRPRPQTARRPSRTCRSRPGPGRRGPAARARATSSCSSVTAWARHTGRRRASCRAASTTARPRAGWRWTRWR